MFVSIYYKPSLFNVHTMILIVHIFMNVNKLCLFNQGQAQDLGQQRFHWRGHLRSCKRSLAETDPTYEG